MKKFAFCFFFEAVCMCVRYDKQVRIINDTNLYSIHLYSKVNKDEEKKK